MKSRPLRVGKPWPRGRHGGKGNPVALSKNGARFRTGVRKGVRDNFRVAKEVVNLIPDTFFVPREYIDAQALARASQIDASGLA